MNTSPVSNLDTTAINYATSLRILAQELTYLPPKSFQLLVFILSRTMRFGKNTETIPLRHFTDGIYDSEGNQIQSKVGLSINNVSHGLDQLEQAGVITVSRLNRNARSITLNPDIFIDGADSETMSRLRRSKSETREANSRLSRADYPTEGEETTTSGSRMRVGKGRAKRSEVQNNGTGIQDTCTTSQNISSTKKQNTITCSETNFEDEDDIVEIGGGVNIDDLITRMADEFDDFDPIQFHHFSETSFTNLVKLSFTNLVKLYYKDLRFFKNKIIKCGNPLDSVKENIKKAEERSKAASEKKSARAPKHRKAMDVFINATKNDNQNWKQLSVSTIAMRNLRLVTDTMTPDEAVAFANDVYANWRHLLSGSLAYLLTSNPRLADLPNPDVFGIHAKRFQQELINSKSISENHSRFNRRAALTSNTAPQPTPKQPQPAPEPTLEERLRAKILAKPSIAAAPIDELAARRAKKAESNKTATSKAEAQREKVRAFVNEVEAYAETHGVSYEEAYNVIAFRD